MTRYPPPPTPRSKRSSRLFGQPSGMLLVEEYLGTPRPDPELLPLYSHGQSPELVEMPDEEDEATEEEDEDDTLQRVILQNRAASRGPARIALPPSRPPLPPARPLLPPSSSRAVPSSPPPRPSTRDVVQMAPEPLFVGARAEPVRLALPTRPEEEPSLVLAAAAPEDYEDDDDSSEEDSDDDIEEIGAGMIWEDEDSAESAALSPGGGGPSLSAASVSVGIAPSPRRAALRLSMDSEQLEDLRNLEERRRFDTPIWGPAPGATGYDEDISLFDESDESDEEYDENGLFSGIGARGRDRSSNSSGGGGGGGSFVFDQEEEEDDVRAYHRGRRVLFGDDDEDDAGGDDDDDDLLTPLTASVRISPFSETDASRSSADISGDPLDPPDISEWDSPPVVPIRASVLPREPSPEADPVRSYGVLPEDEPSQTEDGSVFPRSAPPAPRPQPPPPDASDSQWGTSLIWLLAALCLLSVGSWAIYVLVEQLSTPIAVAEPLSPTPTAPSAPTPGEAAATVATTPPPSSEPLPEPVPTAPAAAVLSPSPAGDEIVMGDASERLEMTLGKLLIETDRKSTVYINNKRIGTTPLGLLDLEAGVYDVRVVALSTGRSRTARARVDASKVTQIQVNFQ